MKTAISVPDDLFQQADRLAKRLKKSRSRLYAEALEEYVRRHEPRQSYEAWNDIGPALLEDPAWRAWIQHGYENVRKLEW